MESFHKSDRDHKTVIEVSLLSYLMFIIFIYNYCFMVTVDNPSAILFHSLAEVFKRKTFFRVAIVDRTLREEIQFQRSRTYVADKKGRLSRSARARNSDKSIRQYWVGWREGMEGRREFLRSRYHPVCFVEGSD